MGEMVQEPGPRSQLSWTEGLGLQSAAHNALWATVPLFNLLFLHPLRGLHESRNLPLSKCMHFLGNLTP